MNNAIEIATVAFAFIFYTTLIVKQHIAYRGTDTPQECIDRIERENPDQFN
jgi:hypothetical protein